MRVPPRLGVAAQRSPGVDVGARPTALGVAERVSLDRVPTPRDGGRPCWRRSSACRHSHVDVSPAQDGAALGSLFERSEIDALLSANAPQTGLDGSPTIRRLYEASLTSKDVAAERYWYTSRLSEVQSMLPWTNVPFERNHADLPEDW